MIPYEERQRRSEQPRETLGTRHPEVASSSSKKLLGRHRNQEAPSPLVPVPATQFHWWKDDKEKDMSTNKERREERVRSAKRTQPEPDAWSAWDYTTHNARYWELPDIEDDYHVFR